MTETHVFERIYMFSPDRQALMDSTHAVQVSRALLNKTH
jgi:hypothetical protein